MVDMTSPLNQDDTLLYRLVGSYTHGGRPGSHLPGAPRALLAALTYAPPFDTTLTYERMEMEAVPEQENNMRISNRNSPYYGQVLSGAARLLLGQPQRPRGHPKPTLCYGTPGGGQRSTSTSALTPATRKASGGGRTPRVSGAGSSPDADGNVQRYVSGQRIATGTDRSAWTSAARPTPAHSATTWLTGAGYGHPRRAPADGRWPPTLGRANPTRPAR